MVVGLNARLVLAVRWWVIAGEMLWVQPVSHWLAVCGVERLAASRLDPPYNSMTHLFGCTGSVRSTEVEPLGEADQGSAEMQPCQG